MPSLRTQCATVETPIQGCGTTCDVEKDSGERNPQRQRNLCADCQDFHSNASLDPDVSRIRNAQIFLRLPDLPSTLMTLNQDSTVDDVFEIVSRLPLDLGTSNLSRNAVKITFDWMAEGNEERATKVV